MHILTIDQGTSSTKTALWDADGGLVAEASAPCELDRPSPTRAEIAPDRWWDALCSTVREVLGRSGVAPASVAAVALDAIGWTLVPTDAALRPVAPAMTWMDRRAEAEAAALSERPDAASIIALAANPLDAAYCTPKVAWLHAHRPEVLDAARWLLTASGWLVGRLTGEATCDPTQAYAFHCYDIARNRWDADAADRLGIPIDRLPPIVPTGAAAGTVTDDAARATGLLAGTPVLAGGLDAAIGALGGGVTRPGLTQDQGGSAGGFGMSVGRVVVEPRLILSAHAVPGQWLLQSGTVGGGSLAWFRDVIGRRDMSFDAITAEAAGSPVGANGVLFLPYLAGERTPLWSSTPRGVFIGMTYATTRADMLRAVMEGCAFTSLDNLRYAEDAGFGVSEWLGQGGATRSGFWNQVKADVTGRPFVVARRVGGGEGGHGLGLFALGAAAVHLAGDPAETVEHLLTERTVHEPDRARHARYAELFEVWRGVSRGLLPHFDRLAAVTGGWAAA
jgi:xylulokinase